MRGDSTLGAPFRWVLLWSLLAALVTAGFLGGWSVFATVAETGASVGRWWGLAAAFALLVAATVPLRRIFQFATRGLAETARLETELEEARHTADTLRLAIEAAPCGMIMVNGAGRIEMVNTETERLFGYERDELLGRQVEMLVPASVRDVHHGHRRSYMAQPAARLMGGGRDLFGVRKDGEEFPVEVGLNPIRTSEGAFVFGAVTDITERIRSEQELLRHTDELQRSNAELEQFAYVASHDLQEPLRMVASFTGLLADRYRGKLDERADQYIHYALDGSRRMQQLIRDLLAYSRINSQGRPLADVATSELADDVLQDFSAAIEEAGAEIDVGDLPIVEADASQLRQVFANLVSNALKFRSDESPRIRIAAEADESTWHFTIADNGIGIDPAYVERVFQMFQRLHERERYDGSGIGLAISKRIVERHGGKIWFESGAGDGTTFHFTLPKAARELSETGIHRRSKESA